MFLFQLLDFNVSVSVSWIKCFGFNHFLFYFLDLNVSVSISWFQCIGFNFFISIFWFQLLLFLHFNVTVFILDFNVSVSISWFPCFDFDILIVSLSVQWQAGDRAFEVRPARRWPSPAVGFRQTYTPALLLPSSLAPLRSRVCGTQGDTVTQAVRGTRLQWFRYCGGRLERKGGFQLLKLFYYFPHNTIQTNTAYENML
jgi:hypothetical protein